MGSFVAAAIASFALYWSWRDGRVGLREPAILAAVGIVIAAMIKAHAFTWGAIWDQLSGGGWIARILLGIALGFGAGWVVEQRQNDLKSARLGGSNAAPWGLADWGAAMSAAAAVALLAVFAPVIDDWLPRITGLKTAVVEFQVQRQTDHHVAVADATDITGPPFALISLQGFPKRLHQEIQYLKLIERPEVVDRLEQTTKQFSVFPPDADELIKKLQKIDRRWGRLEYLYNMFSELLVPVSHCFQEAIENKLSLQSVQNTIRPSVDRFEQLVLRNNRLNDDAEDYDTWEKLVRAAKEIDQRNMADIPACHNIAESATAIFIRLDEQIAPGEIYSSTIEPNLLDDVYSSYAYLIVALFLNFEQDDDVALAILNEEAIGPSRDYAYYRLLSNLRWRQGQLTSKIIEPLEASYQDISLRKRRIKNHCSILSCTQDVRDKLKVLAQQEDEAELILVNNYAYFVAEDIARGIDEAKTYEATAEDFAERIQQAIDPKTSILNISADDADDYIDTYVYVRTVLEAEKSAPDVVTLKKMRRSLQGVIEHLEHKLQGSKDSVFSRFDLGTLKLARSHYASLQQLIGEQ